MSAQLFDAEFRKDFPNVVRWYNTLVHFPHFSAVFVNKDLCKQRLKCKSGMLEHNKQMPTCDCMRVWGSPVA